MAEGPAQPLPLPIREIDIKFLKLFKSVHFEGQKVMMRVIREVYKNSVGNETLTLGEYLQRKGLDTRHVEECLDENLMERDFDVTFTIKLLNKILCDDYENLDEKCRSELNHLRIMRNKLSHIFHQEDLNMTTEIDRLKTLYKNIYKGIGAVLGVDFSSDIKTVEQNLSQICNAKVIEDCPEAMNSFLEALMHTFIIEGKAELKQRYEKLRAINPCTWFLFDDPKIANSALDSFYIDKIYTPLKIETTKGKIEIEDMLKMKREIGGEEVTPPVLLLHGLAGCGKTSLCRYLLHKWTRNNGDTLGLGSDDVDLVILVEARSVQEKTLHLCLKDRLFLKTYSIISEKLEASSLGGTNIDDTFLTELQKLRVLFIVDGFDEASKETIPVLEKIIDKFGRDHRIIVTTRPEFVSDLDSRLSRKNIKYLIIKISGFDDERIEEFSKKVFEVALLKKNKMPCQCRREAVKFIEYIRGRARILGEHLNLPLTLALLIYLWIDKVKVDGAPHGSKILSEVTNCTSLYFHVFKHCQKKLCSRLGNESVKLEDLDKLMLSIGKVAWESLTSHQVNIRGAARKQIENACDRFHVDKTEMMSAFLMCDIDENQDSKNQKSYSFLHKTQMEYMAAQYLADLMIQSKLCDEIQDVENWQRLQQVVIFLMGHISLLHNDQLSSKDLEFILSLVDQSQDTRGCYDFWWKLLVEASKNKVVGKKIAKDKLPSEVWRLTTKVDEFNKKIDLVVPGLELLMATPARIKELVIEVDRDPYEIKNLKQVMQELRFKLRSRYNKEHPLLTELRFWKHEEEYSFTRSSDDLVRMLHPWGHLTSFVGSLGEQEEGKELLNYCFKLKTIRVRFCSLKALICFSVSLEKIFKNIRQLRVTLEISPDDVEDPSCLPSLIFNGNLEITLPGMCDKHKEWVVGAVKRLTQPSRQGRGQGCQHLTLSKSELTCEAVEYIVRQLQGDVTEKMSVQTQREITEEHEDRMEKLVLIYHIKVNWI